jgi:hypothetical protein
MVRFHAGGPPGKLTIPVDPGWLQEVLFKIFEKILKVPIPGPATRSPWDFRSPLDNTILHFFLLPIPALLLLPELVVIEDFLSFVRPKRKV